MRIPLRIFLSHTSELREFPRDGSFVAAAEAAVRRAEDAVINMAYFTARDDPAAGYCQDRVREADVYVGLIGLRYGSLVHGQPQASYTELEFDTATEAGKPRLIFLLDADESAPIPPECLPENDTTLTERQRAFRDRLLDAGVMVAKFAEPVRLELLLFQALQALHDQPPFGPMVAGEVPQQPQDWQSRPALLAALQDAGPGSRVVVQAVTGMWGVGKTQLAAAAARSRLDQHWRLVAWINAETEGTLLAGLADTASAVDLPAAADAAAAGRAVRHWLETGGTDCLVVFDNATDAELLRRYLPAAGKAQVIITSTRHDITSLGEPVNVDVFTEPEGLAFLSRRTGLDDAAGARAVGEEVGWLPLALALAQAAAVIASQRLDYATYLGRLQLRVEGLLRPIEASGYPYGTAAVILLSLGDVATGDDTGACADVMALLAVLSAGGVRRALVHAAVKSRIPEDDQPAGWLPDEVADRALARLAGASLLTFTVDGTAVTAHRLVTRVIRDQLAATGRLADVCQVAARLLDARATALSPSWHEDPAAARDLIEQITALHQSSAQCPDADRRAPVMVPPRVWAVWLLNQLGDNPDRAIQIGEPLLADSLRILGLGHALTLSARNDLAHAYYYAGRTKDSIRLYRRNLAERERLLGPDDPDHPDILASRGNLATAYLQAGQTGAAIILHERNLADRERTLGPDHRDLLSTRFNLARAYAQAERTDDAIAMFERTLADCERTLPTDHVNTLLACDNLASTYRRAGRTPEAITLHERALAARSRILGADHPHTLASRNHLAAAYRAAGRAADAAALVEPSQDAQ